MDEVIEALVIEFSEILYRARKRRREIIRILRDVYEMSYGEIAKKTGVSRQRLHQLGKDEKK